MKIKEVVAALERFAPLPLQDSYDNAGLQIGLPEAEASGVLLCLDVTEAVIDEALRLGANLIVSHHPLLFKGIKCLADRNLVERCVRATVQTGVAVYAAHTNLDNARGGVNFAMGRLLGLTDMDFLLPQGEGGSGVVGRLPAPMAAQEFLERVADVFDVECLQHNRLLHHPISRVALCGGSGDFLLERAISAGADAFLTGEMHYHVYFGHEDEIQIGVLGHYQSERHTIELLRGILADACPDVPLHLTHINTNPICYLHHSK